MAQIGPVKITHHVLRLGGSDGAPVLLEDGSDTWQVEPDATDSVQVYKVVLEQLARQGYRIVDIGRGCTTLQLEDSGASENAGPTGNFQLERIEAVSAPSPREANIHFLASHGLPTLPRYQADQGMALLRSGNKIALIKWLREVQPGQGLKESKEQADRLMAAQGVPSSSSGCGAAVLVPLIVGGVGAAVRYFF
jgi:hypothetical protein